MDRTIVLLYAGIYFWLRMDFNFYFINFITIEVIKIFQYDEIMTIWFYFLYNLIEVKNYFILYIVVLLFTRKIYNFLYN